MAIGRFQVMAMLQAARAYRLGLPLESSLSWGLNRAIFYAAAKRGFRRLKMPRRPRGEALAKPLLEERDIFYLGDEMAYKTEVDGILYFTIGGKPQTAEDFRREIVRRFGDAFDEAWREALEIVGEYDRETLLSQRRFYEEVYKPRRDLLAERWTKLVRERRRPTASS